MFKHCNVTQHYAVEGGGGGRGGEGRREVWVILKNYILQANSLGT